MLLDSVPSLLEAIRQLRLLEHEQLNQLIGLQDRFLNAKALAKELLQRGWLTPYQANLLLQGRGQDLVLGSYALLERVGEGGMGQVFKARNWKLGQVVALKVIRKEWLAHPDAIRRFHREIRAAAQLAHPNIVHAYDADEIGGAHFFAMEYVQGFDLARLVKQRGQLPLAQACDCIRQAALGLQHAHERGMVHRDIKPHNLLLTSEGVIKVLDMGLARLREAAEDGEKNSIMTQEGAVMGTPDYIAPEQAQESHTVDIRADLYSLGCTLYFLLTGQVPFPGGTLIQKVNCHQFKEPKPIEEIRPEVPRDLARLLRKLMAKRPEDRYQTPGELAIALTSVTESIRQFPPMAANGADRTVITHPLARPGGGSIETMFESALAHMVTPAPSVPQSPARRLFPLANNRRWPVINGVGALMLLGLVAVLVAHLGRDSRPKKDSNDERPEPAALALRELHTLVEDPATDPEQLRKKLILFRQKYQGTAQAVEAGRWLMQVPSPLDNIDQKTIPTGERLEGQPAELVAILGTRRGRHWGAVRAVAFSPDGKWLASAGEDRVVRLWDAATLREQSTLRGHTDIVTTVAIAPKGHPWVASGSYDGTVRLWDLSQTEPRAGPVLRSKEGAIAAVSFAPDGRTLAFAGGTTVRMWDLSGEHLIEGPVLRLAQPGSGLAFSPDGKTLACGCTDGTVRLWELSGHEAKERANLEGHTGRVNAICFSPDSKNLAAGTDRKLLLWDLTQFPPVPRDVHREGNRPGDSRVNSVAFSPDSKTIVIDSDYEGRIWFWDLLKATVNVRTGFFWHEGFKVNSLAFAPTGDVLALGTSQGQLLLIDLKNGTIKDRVELPGHRGPITALQFSSDGTGLASASNDLMVRRWNLSGPEPQERDKPEWHPAAVSDLAYSPDGKFLATICQPEGIRLRRLDGSETGFQSLPQKQASDASVVAFDPRGKRIAAGSTNGTVRLWDLAGGDPKEHVLSKHTGSIVAVAFTPDGQTLASAGQDQVLWLWNLSFVKPKEKYELKLPAVATTVAFALDGKLLATGFADGTIRLWDLAGGGPKQHSLLEEHKTSICFLGFMLDGRTLISASLDGRIVLWNVEAGKKQKVMRIQGPINRVALAPDGRHLATGNGNGTIYILRLFRMGTQGE